MRGSVRFSNGVKTATSRCDMEKPSVKFVLHEGIKARPLPQASPLQYCRRMRCDCRGLIVEVAQLNGTVTHQQNDIVRLQDEVARPQRLRESLKVLCNVW